jgi:branched-chain amino acid transport system permease protein
MDKDFNNRRRRELITAAFFAALAATVPLFVKDVYVQNIMVLTLMYAALSQAWNVLSGYCGQISLGHALYSDLAPTPRRSCSRSSACCRGSVCLQAG